MDIIEQALSEYEPDKNILIYRKYIKQAMKEDNLSFDEAVFQECGYNLTNLEREWLKRELKGSKNI